MNDWLIWLTLGGVIIWALIHAARKRRKEQAACAVMMRASLSPKVE